MKRFLKLSALSVSGCSLDLALLVDTSGSIEDADPANIVRIANFLVSITRAVDLDEVHIALVTFGNHAKVEFYLNTFSTEREYVTAIKNYTYDGGWTRTRAALGVVRDQVFVPEHGDREGVPNIILLITDGNPTDSGPELTQEAAQLKDEYGVKVLIVAVSTFHMPFDEEVAEILASRPIEEHFFEVEDYNSLSARLNEIIQQTCRPDNTSTVVSTANCRLLAIAFSNECFRRIATS